MKKSFLCLVCFVYSLNIWAQTENLSGGISVGSVSEKGTNLPMVEVYCEVMCVQYNLFKQDVNALVDFGIAEKAKYANGWIYDTDRNKKTSFASPMSVFSFMAKHGWKYKDAIIVTEGATGGKKLMCGILF